MAAQQQKEKLPEGTGSDHRTAYKRGKGADASPSQLLCALQQLCVGIPSKYFKITLLYYNPNISLKEEYEARVREQKRLIGEMDFVHPVQFMEGKYLPEEFYRAVKGHEEDKEGENAALSATNSALGRGNCSESRRL